MAKRTKRTFIQNNIEALRLERGLTQRALGELANTTGPTINRLEKSQRGLDTDDLFLYARILGVHPDKIVDMSEFKEKTEEFDKTVYCMVVGWIVEACEKEKIKIAGDKLADWAMFAYNEVIEQDMRFQEMRQYSYDFVKLHAAGKSKK